MFVGIGPSTGDKESPAVWADVEQQELVLQGWKPGPEPEAECAAIEVPGHADGTPARMLHIVREACDVLEANVR
ncbi:hypothetical protein AB0O18_08820 [Streptomyces sp. NPDC093224]|uniref:hypothetical protein n=1 Tax=Streptomyces sp. NPDC093224 TaxID=3155198 RepID=UPI00342F6A7B